MRVDTNQEVRIAILRLDRLKFGDTVPSHPVWTLSLSRSSIKWDKRRKILAEAPNKHKIADRILLVLL